MTAAATDKAGLSLATAADWHAGRIGTVGRATPPDHPARPPRPEILPPRQMKRRGTGNRRGKVALLHALAHIEFNAIDLAWDIIARFGDQDLPLDYYNDWVTVAAEETRHFLSLLGLLHRLDADYGDLPAHDGLWDAAGKTAFDLRARLAVVPLVLEARALDTAPAAMVRLEEVGDAETGAILARILADEIGHVAVGVRWFDFLCRRAGDSPATTFRQMISPYFPKGLKPPFNHVAREQAGFPASWYAGDSASTSTDE